MMRQLVGIIIFVLISSVAVAQDQSNLLPPVQMSVKAEDKIEIRGYRGVVEYEVDRNSNEISVEARQTFDSKWKFQDEWQFSMRREGSKILIQIEGPTSKRDWQEAFMTKQIPLFAIKITGPSRPLSINWSEGQVKVNGVEASVEIAAVSSEIVVRKGEGSTNVTNSDGSIKVANRKGSLKIETYRAKTEVEDIEGSLDLQNFAGDTRVQNINGTAVIGSYSGQTHLASLKGRLEFTNGISSFHIEKFEGELRGKTQQGAVYADIRGEANVRLEANEGSVNLKMPSSAAWVNLGTADGSLYVPSFLKLTRLATQQIRTGRLRNGAHGGSVFVRTSSGNIRVR